MLAAGVGVITAEFFDTGESRDLCLPVPVPPDPARLTHLAATHGIQILPPPEP